jgi:hypothetical protein
MSGGDRKILLQYLLQFYINPIRQINLQPAYEKFSLYLEKLNDSTLNSFIITQNQYLTNKSLTFIILYKKNIFLRLKNVCIFWVWPMFFNTNYFIFVRRWSASQCLSSCFFCRWRTKITTKFSKYNNLLVILHEKYSTNCYWLYNWCFTSFK